MADFVTPYKSLTEPTVGGDNNEWGGILNTDLSLIDSALGGTVSIAITGNTTLTTTQAENTGYVFTGSLSASATITWPTYYGLGIIKNATAQTLICGVSGTTASIPATAVAAIWSDGTNFYGLTEPLITNGVEMSAAGVFTNTQMNQPATFLTGGINLTTEYTHEQGGNYSTDAVAGGISVPSGSTVYGANGVAGYCNSASTASNPVAGYFQARCLAAGAKIWGLNSVADDGGFVTTVQSIEVDVNSSNVSSTVAGVDVVGVLTGGAHGNGVVVQATSSPFAWAFNSEDGAALTGLNIGAVAKATPSSNSQTVALYALDASTTHQPCTLVAQAETSSANLIITASTTGNVVMGSPLGLRNYTVSTLPAASAPLWGCMAWVTDATSPTYLGTLTGGGSVSTPVFCNGTAWVSH